MACKAVVISDTGMPSLKFPALTYALRGIIACEVTVHGPSRDLHSGIYGGTVDNPAIALCQILAQLRDQKGRVNIPGFYDGVAEKAFGLRAEGSGAAALERGRNIGNFSACQNFSANAVTLLASNVARVLPLRSMA